MNTTQKKIFTTKQIKRAQIEVDYHASIVEGIKKNLEYKKKNKTNAYLSYSFGNSVEDLKLAKGRKKEEENLLELLTDYRKLLDRVLL